jgi:hypothetical protein
MAPIYTYDPHNTGCELPEDDSIKAYNTLARKLLPLDEPYPKYTAGHLFAAQYVQAAVRGFLARYGISHRGGEAAAAVQAAAAAGAAGPQPAHAGRSRRM